jgi:PAS domain S-box-containing protein
MEQEENMGELNRNHKKKLVGIKKSADKVSELGGKALSVSETQPLCLFEAAEDGIITLNFNTGVIIDVNPLVEEIFGCSHEELIGKAIWEIGFFKDIAADKDKFLELRQKKCVRYEDLPLKTVNGQQLNVEFISKVYSINHHKVIRFNIRNKTRHKRLEAEIRESEERLRMVFENVFDGISLYSEDPDPFKRELVECNDRYAVMAGRSREELLQLKNLERLQIALDHTANKNRLESLESGTAFQGTFSWLRPDGKENVIEYLAKSITWRGKKYMIGIDREITGRKRAENELIESETKFSRTFDHSPVGSAFVDLDQRFFKCNLAFCNFLGYKENELIGKTFSDVTYPEDIELGGKKFKQIVEREMESCSLKKRFVRKDGNIVWGRINLCLIRDANDNPLFFFPIIQDITEDKNIETGLEKTRKELAEVKISADEVSEFAENLINTVREPLIALDKDLRVVKASRSFYEFFKVSSDETIGTLIYDLGNRQWDIPKLRELLETILPEKTTFDNYEVEHDFTTIGKRIMLLNARKIQTGWGKEQIILLAIEDITERKEIETGLEKTRKELAEVKISADEESEFAENLIDTVREPLIALDKDLRVVKASRSFYEFFKVSSDETIGTLIYDLGNRQWDIPKLKELLETILPEKTTFDNYEVEHDFTTIGKRIMLLNARKIQTGWGKEQIILLAIEDITERKEIETGLEKTRKELAEVKISADEESEFAENLIDTVREPLIALDKDLRVVKASRSFYEFFKVSSDETIGTLIYDLGNRQWNIPKLKELLETILLKQTTFDNYEVEHDFTTIGKRIMLLNARKIQRGSGKEQVILLAIEDITERKEIETGLEKTRKELAEVKISADEVSEFAENLIDTVREPLIALDKNLRVVKASRSFYEFFKVSSDETIGTLIYDLGNRQWNIPKLKELLETILLKQTTFDNYEVEHDFTTIGKRIMLLNARKIQRGSGKEQVILLAIEDITERKEIETGLEKTRKELAEVKISADEVGEFAENLINTVREPLIALDKNLRVVKASRSFYEFFKVSSGETIGTLIYDLGNRQWDIPKLRELLETILPEKTTFDNYEVEHDFSTIGKRIMLLNARKIQTGLGKEQIILLAIEDITERKKNENELSKAKAEAEQANAAKSEFLSRMSHELRTPMNSILGFAQLMDMEELNPTHKKGVNQILKNGKHLLELINEVLDIARIETGRVTVSLEPVNIFDIILETIDIVRNLAEENQIMLESGASIVKGLFVKADHQRLKQVFLNLITNAVKYNRKGGSVKIECKILKPVRSMEDAEGRKENVIRISVIDTGRGIAQEYIEKLFNPFERIGAERTETEGTGLGLAISKKLIEAMSGKVGVESEINKGSTFWIELPQTESQKDRFERVCEIEGPEAEITKLRGTILYIEDNLSNIQLVEQILETYRPSIKLITNIYGNNAVQFAIDYKPDLILLDLDLPDIHGSEVIKLLQAEPGTAEIPVIILSADAITKQIEQLMQTGAKDYLIKPIDVVHFLTVVDKWVRRVKP